MKPADLKPRKYINFNKESNKEGSKFEVGDHVRIQKYKTIFVKSQVSDWFEEAFVIKKLKTLCRGHMLLAILTEKKLLECFVEKNSKNQIKNSLELEK